MSVFSPSFVDGLHEGRPPGPWIGFHLPYDEYVEIDHVNGLFSAGLQNSFVMPSGRCLIISLPSSRVGVLLSSGSGMCESEG